MSVNLARDTFQAETYSRSECESQSAQKNRGRFAKILSNIYSSFPYKGVEI